MKTIRFRILLLSAAILKVCFSFAQVDAIRSASKNSGSEHWSSGSVSTGWYVEMAYYSVEGLIGWQKEKLKQREENAELVSIDLMLSVAAQPSSYYVINPRVRGNWGVFSTDFRLNYILEEGIDGVKYIRTNDWQILQLNIVTNRNLNFYIGGGIINESFSDSRTYPEYSTCLYFKPSKFPVGFQAEYRISEPRSEINAIIRKSILERPSTNIYFTLGALRQRYYNSVTVWGIQAGVLVKVF